MKRNDENVTPMLTDLYQITSTYAYWKTDKHQDPVTFDMFYRKNPFGGAFSIFAGLSRFLDFVENFRFTEADIAYLKSVLPQTVELDFFEWLMALDCSTIKVTAVPEGTVVFPRVPLVTIEGPRGIAQLLETTLLNLVNSSTLTATKAARMRDIAGFDAQILEFGARRAAGPDGAMTASEAAYLGGFDATSNVLAGQLLGIPVRGTHPHPCVSNGELDRIDDTR